MACGRGHGQKRVRHDRAREARAEKWVARSCWVAQTSHISKRKFWVEGGGTVVVISNGIVLNFSLTNLTVLAYLWSFWVVFMLEIVFGLFWRFFVD